MLLIIQIKRRGQQSEQDKYLVQIRHRNMPDIRCDQITFVPAHHQRGRPHHQTGVSHFARQPIDRGQFRPNQRDPIRHGRQNKQHAHPHHQRLAGKQITQAKHRFAARQITAVPRHCEQADRRYHRKYPLQRAPEPAQQNDGQHAEHQDDFLVHIHQVTIFQATIGKQRDHQNSEHAVAPTQARPKRWFARRSVLMHRQINRREIGVVYT